jgi:hypothetical protein
MTVLCYCVLSVYVLVHLQPMYLWKLNFYFFELIYMHLYLTFFGMPRSKHLCVCV